MSRRKPSVQAIAGELRRLVEAGFAAAGVPGGSVQIVEGDGEVEAIPYGTLTPEIPVVLGSTSKSITAIALVQAVEAGYVALDDPVHDWLPAVGFPADVTVKDLARHTSGLATDSTPTHRRFARDRGFRYANENYNLLGRVIETATGIPFGQWVAERLFEPLGIKNELGPRTAPEAVPGHVGVFGLFIPARLSDRGPKSWIQPPSGAICMSARDAGRILRMLLNDGELEGKRLLAPESVHMILTDTVPTGLSSAIDGPLGPEGDYGFGWIRKSLNGEEVFLHVGKVPTHTTVFALIPGRNLAMVLVADGGDFLVAAPLIEQLADSVIRHLLGEPVQMPTPRAHLVRHAALGALCLGVLAVGAAGWFFRGGKGGKNGFLAYHALLPLTLILGMRRASVTPSLWVWRFAPDVSSAVGISAASMMLSGIWRISAQHGSGPMENSVGERAASCGGSSKWNDRNGLFR